MRDEMAYPAGVVTRQVNFGAAVGMENAAEIEMRVHIKASRSLVWAATGTPVISLGASFTAKGGTQGELALPVTDQAGWADGVGGVVPVGTGLHSHTYSAIIEYFVAGIPRAKVVLEPFVLPAGATVVDLDNLVPVSPGAESVPVLVPDSWSAQITQANKAVTDAMRVISQDLPNAMGSELSRKASPALIAVNETVVKSGVASGLFFGADSYGAGGVTGGQGTESPLLLRGLVYAPPFLLSANSGFRVDQIATAMAASMAANPTFQPKVAVVLGGMNDALQNTPRATTKAAYLQIRDMLHDRGITPVFTTPPPHYTEEITARSRPISAWLIDNAATEGWLVADLSGLVDAATGNMAVGYRYDNIHVNGLGQTVIADAIRDVIKPLFPKSRRRLPNAPQGYDNKMSNALFGGTVTGGWPLGWATLNGAGTGPVTPSVITPDPILHPGWLGKVYRMAFASGATTYGWKFWTGNVITPGVKYAVTLRMRLSNMPATIAAGAGVQLQLRWANATTTYVYGPVAYSGSDMLLDFEAVAPAGATGCDVTLYWSGGQGTIDIGEIGLLDLTARTAA